MSTEDSTVGLDQPLRLGSALGRDKLSRRGFAADEMTNRRTWILWDGRRWHSWALPFDGDAQEDTP